MASVYFIVPIAKMAVKEVKDHLIAVNQGEMVHIYFLGTDFRDPSFWIKVEMQMKESEREINWEIFVMKIKHVECTKTWFQNMVADVLNLQLKPGCH